MLRTPLLSFVRAAPALLQRQGASLIRPVTSSSALCYCGTNRASAPPLQASAGDYFHGMHTGTKSHKVQRSPVSQAVALLVSKDNIPRDRLLTQMSQLSATFVGNIRQQSTTEIAAFCEVCKKLDFCVQNLADAVVDAIQGQVDQLQADELAGVLWVLSSKEEVPMPLMRELSDVLLAQLLELRHEDLPDIVAAVADLGFQDALMLTALCEAVQQHLPEYTAPELSSLVRSYGASRLTRTFFDNRLLKGLADQILTHMQEFDTSQLRAIVDTYAAVSARHTALAETNRQLAAAAAPQLSPTPA